MLTPFKNQQTALGSNAKIKCVIGGCRQGKTYYLYLEALKQIKQVGNTRIAFIEGALKPYNTIMNGFIEILKSEGIEYKKCRETLSFPNGTIIIFLKKDNLQEMLGLELVDLMLINEPKDIEESDFNIYMQSRLICNNGKLVLSGIPSSRKWDDEKQVMVKHFFEKFWDLGMNNKKGYSSHYLGIDEKLVEKWYRESNKLYNGEYIFE